MTIHMRSWVSFLLKIGVFVCKRLPWSFWDDYLDLLGKWMNPKLINFLKKPDLKYGFELPVRFVRLYQTVQVRKEARVLLVLDCIPKLSWLKSLVLYGRPWLLSSNVITTPSSYRWTSLETKIKDKLKFATKWNVCEESLKCANKVKNVRINKRALLELTWAIHDCSAWECKLARAIHEWVAHEEKLTNVPVMSLLS